MALTQAGRPSAASLTESIDSALDRVHSKLAEIRENCRQLDGYDRRRCLAAPGTAPGQDQTRS